MRLGKTVSLNEGKYPRTPARLKSRPPDSFARFGIQLRFASILGFPFLVKVAAVNVVYHRNGEILHL